MIDLATPTLPSVEKSKTPKRRKIDKSILYSMSSDDMKEANEVSKQSREELDVQKVIKNYREE